MTIAQLLNDNPVTVSFLAGAIALCFCVAQWSGPDVLINCPNGASMVVSVPSGLDKTDRAELLSGYTIPAMCGVRR